MAANAIATTQTQIATTQKTGAERRRYPRLVFSPKDGVTAGLCFAMPNGYGLIIQAMVMNLSRGGLGLGILREEMEGLSLTDGNLLVVNELRIAYQEVCLSLDVEAQIRWHIDADYIDHTCFGCAFKTNNDALQEKLAGFVANNFSHLELT